MLSFAYRYVAKINNTGHDGYFLILYKSGFLQSGSFGRHRFFFFVVSLLESEG